MITCISSIKSSSSSSSSSIVSLIFLQEADNIYFNECKAPEARFVMVTANKTRMISSAKQIGMSKMEGEGKERRIEERAREERAR